MALSIADQIALDDALVAPADRLKIGKCNLRLSSDVTSKEATLQVVYDVLKLTPFYKAFQVTADAPEIYMQEFWASAYVHNRSVRFKMNNKKHIIGLEQFRDILQICPRVVGGLHFSRFENETIRRREMRCTILDSPSYLNNASTAPKEKKYGKAKQKTTELKTISEADLTEAEQLKIIIKRSRQETHSSHASGSGADEGTGVTPGVPRRHLISKNDVNETKQDDEDDDDHDDDEKVQDNDEHEVDETAQEDDDAKQTESDDDGDDFFHLKLTTHDDEIIHEEDTDDNDSSISSSDEENSDNEVEGTNVEGAKSDEEATYEEDQGTEAVEDTKTDLDGRDEVMTDVILPQSSSVSSGFVSNMLNPNQDTDVDDIC
ncbi:hypothetical protein Tco_0539612 [Tanacetum coccineum]